ncbi:MAG: hypothetical protein P8J68_10335 [Arenicellaceae bacterium]|nr:hypothetical protein [Arenicellaceae bacterium]
MAIMSSGNPSIGSGSSTPSRTMRRVPVRSVISMSPSGRNANDHGCDKPRTTGTTRTSLILCVLMTNGCRDNSTRGSPGSSCA